MFISRKVSSNSFLKVSVGAFGRKMHSDVLKTIFMEGVSSVEPSTLIKRSVRMQHETLYIENKRYPLKSCHLVGFGKAVLGMAVALENILGANLKGGIVTVPTGIFQCFADRPDILPASNSKIRFIEGAKDNLPDESAHEGALAIKQLATNLTEKDLLLVLISGGGSALLPSPKHPVTLQEKLSLVKELSKRGADIFELNCVRKKLSELKGGGLAKFARRASIVGLILSDVVGDPLDFIASGPTVPNTDLDEAALNVVRRYDLSDGLSASVLDVLRMKYEEDGNIVDGKFKNVDNFVIGNNRMAALAAKNRAENLGYQTFILSTGIGGNVDNVAKMYSKLAHLIAIRAAEDLKRFVRDVVEQDDFEDLDFDESICIICAGEPTVVVSGKGVGGRNQELALRFSLEVNKADTKMANISFLSAGTDGIDGPTDASGAIGSSNLVNNALDQDINPTSFLGNNDSYGFYSRYNAGRDLIKIGHTGTNVMDLHIIIIEPTK